MLTEILVGGIKATILVPEDFNASEPVTLALQVHGRTRNKQDCIKFAKYLQAEVPNLVCCCWDLPNHGERLINLKLNDGWDKGNPYHLVEMKAIIDQGACEGVTILRNIDYLVDFKITKKVVVGVSLGGYITWKIAAQHGDLLAAAVPIISSPDLGAVMRFRFQELREQQPEVAKQIEPVAMPPALMDYLNAGTLENQALRKSQLPILAICGAADPLVPPEHTVKWGEHSAPNQRVEIVPGVKHEVAREMIDLTAEYLYSLVSRV